MEKIKIPNDVKYLCDKLESSGYEAYVVGGCVRDSFLSSRTPDDWDITTNATYEQIAEALKDDVFEIEYGTSKQFNVFVCYYNHEKYEIATFRTDLDYEDHRHPVTEITTSIEEDLKRRDFTINAMAYRPSTDELIDLFDGKKDIEDRVIRAVGNPNDRINEDALRILRAYRFSANLGFELDDALEKVCEERFKDVEYCSMERKQMEINKLFSKEIKNKESAKKLLRLVVNDISDETIEMIEYGRHCLEVQWALLLKDIDVNHVYEILNIYKFSTRFIDRVIDILKNKNYSFIDKVSIKKYMSNYGNEGYGLLVMFQSIVGKIDNMQTMEIKKLHRQIIVNEEPYRLSDLKINGNDLIELGYEGQEIGRKLDNLLNVVINNPKYNNKDILISMSRR